MGGVASQDEMVMEAYGEVPPPPDLATLLTKIRGAATMKQPLELSPGELRVLVNLLDADG